DLREVAAPDAAAPLDEVAGDADVVRGGDPGQVDLHRRDGRGRQAGGRGGRLRVGRRAGRRRARIRVRALVARPFGGPARVAESGAAGQPRVHEAARGRGADLGEVAASRPAAPLDDVARDPDVVGGGDPDQVDLRRRNGRGGQHGGRGRRLRVGGRAGRRRGGVRVRALVAGAV